MKQQTTLGLVITIIAIGIVTISLSQNVQAQSLVTDWIKNNAGWWAEGTIDDKTFLD